MDSAGIVLLMRQIKNKFSRTPRYFLLNCIFLFGFLLLACSKSETSEVQTAPDKESMTVNNRIADEAEKIGTAVLLIKKGGREVFSYGDLSKKYMCHSIRKPFLGALYGI